MTKLQTAILVAVGLIAALSAVVGAVLRHHIGGFLRTVEREAEEAREREEAEAAERAAANGESASDGAEEQQITQEQKL